VVHRVAAWLLALAAAATCALPGRAETPAGDSPITSGFWSFPPQKTTTPSEVVAACRGHLQIRFADGHFISLRLVKRETGAAQREVESVGHCAFDRKTQIENCETKIIHSDGSILGGNAENRYSLDAHKVLKVHVTLKMVTDSPTDDAPFDAFPVRCPDDVAWRLLNETTLPK